jgi:NAD(P)-dependent dehydrogenase (short-subunit alcohol dehydrogenase family)
VSGSRFAGRRALVTGASRGIGAAVARRLAADGADVALVARTLDEHPTLAGSLRETATAVEAHGRRAAVVVADLGDAEDRARVVPEAVAALGGPLDVLVNNAAAAIYQPLGDFPLRRRRLTFEVNVHAPLDLAQAAVPAMVERGEGWVVNLTSAAAKLTVGPPFPPDGLRSTIGIYGASKAALDRMTNALAVELEGTGVRVNAVEPRVAVLSEGASALVGHLLDDERLESMEGMVEAVVALCDCPPDLTGGVHVSVDLLQRLGLPVRSLDGG